MRPLPPEIRERILDAVAAKRITEHEAEWYLQQQYGMTLSQIQADAPRRFTRYEKMVGAAVVLAIIALAAILMRIGQGPAAMMIMDVQHNSTAGAIAMTAPVASLRVSGTLYGDGEGAVYFDTPEGSLLVANITSDDGTPQTEKASYVEGEIVRVRNAPAGASYYLDSGSASAAAEVPFDAPAANGTLLIVVDRNGSIETYRLPIIIGEAVRVTPFSSLCVETCSMNQTNGTIRVTTTGLQLTRIEAQTENHPPTLAAPFDPLIIRNTTAINLSGHFADPDGDTLFYTTGPADLATATIDGSLLVLKPLRNGTENITIYASDLRDLVQAQLTITVEDAGVASNGTEEDAAGDATNNASGNTTRSSDAEAENSTATSTANASTTANSTTYNASAAVQNATASNAEDAALDAVGAVANTANETASVGCDDADYNRRPSYCLLNTSRMLDEDLIWEDLDRRPVARITSLGNLVLTGRVIENDVTGAPQAREFTIGYTDSDFNYVPTIWISNGDLHLRGSLYEERKDLSPGSGSYIANNRHGINLLYANRESGDLYLRGNVIMYRKSVSG